MADLNTAAEHLKAAATIVRDATDYGDVHGFNRQNIINDLESLAARIRRLARRS